MREKGGEEKPLGPEGKKKGDRRGLKKAASCALY